jgi:protein-disulfide isomerase
MSKGFWGIVAVVVLLLIGIFVFTGNKNDSNSSSKTASNKPTENIQGKGTSGVKLVEYGDFQCPYCGQAYAPVKEAVTNLNDQIYFQFRNFPLQNVHQNAFSAARAAEAAAQQNKFWEMHDALYENQGQWSSLSNPVPFFEKLASQIGLNASKFKTDYSSSTVNNLINADMAAGTKLGVSGTPTFFLDGKKVDLPYSSGAAAIEKVINDAIAAKQQSKQS